jgi:hypothetical protein
MKKGQGPTEQLFTKHLGEVLNLINNRIDKTISSIKDLDPH